MKRGEKDKLIADFMGVTILSKIEYIELVGCPSYERDNMPDYYPTFYNWNRLMPVAAELINGHYDSRELGYQDLDDLMEAGGRFDIEEIYEEVVNAIIEINKTANNEGKINPKKDQEAEGPAQPL